MAAEVAEGRAQAHQQVRVLLVFLHRETLLLLLSWLLLEERATLGRSVRYWAALEGVVLGALGREGEGMLSLGAGASTAPPPTAPCWPCTGCPWPV